MRAQVDVELDFTEVESTFETYDPNEKGEKTRSEVLSLDRMATIDAEEFPAQQQISHHWIVRLVLMGEPPQNPPRISVKR